MDTVGTYLRRTREARGMSLEEVARATRIPASTVARIENEHFDDLPGEVFVRGFLKSYARAVQLPVDDVLARYSASRRVAVVAPMPTASVPTRKAPGKHVGVAIAFVLLLVLFTLALSILLRPRGHDVPSELSSRSGEPGLHGLESSRRTVAPGRLG